MAVSAAIDRHLGDRTMVLRQPNTRRSPDAPLAGSDTHTAQPRPQDFFSWWAWGVAQASTLQASSPLAVHSESGDRDDWGNASQTIIRGLPFTRAFESFITRDRGFVSGAFTRGMKHLYSRTGKQTDEFKIAYALVSGSTDPEIVRIVLLGSPHRPYFEACAIRALAFIYDKVQIQLAEAKDPREDAGAV